MEALTVRPGLTIPAGELELTAALAGGPGGQHVNKTSTKVLLRFDLAASAALTPAQKDRLRTRVPPRFLAHEGTVILVACDEHRSQLRNREAALARFAEVLREALRRERPRVATKPGKAARAKRKDAKQRDSKKKEGRRSGGSWD